MIKNIIFDFGAVLVDWNPKHLYSPYFQDDEKMDYFLETICPYSWNETVDAGKSTEDATLERIALYPEWEKEIRMYYGEWTKMVSGEIEGMYTMVERLKQAGLKLYGLSNWSYETFPWVENKFPVFKLLDGYVVSGFERTAKPQEKIYRILLERYGIHANESIFIDDNPRNLVAGENLGIRGVQFFDAATLKGQLEELQLL